MRTTFIWAGVLVLAAAESSAQNDRTFPNDLGIWYIAEGQMDPWFEWYTTYHEVAYVHEPQVLLDGRSWGRVLWQWWEEEPVGLMSVDSGRVIFKSLNPYPWSDLFSYYDTTARVLYDFGLLVGDTAYQQSEPVTVIAEDTVQLWGRARRQLYLSNEDEWIEGIGSIHGLFYPWAPTWGLEATGYEMTSFCGYYMDADPLLYQMCLPDAISELVVQKVRIAPNPCRGEFTIRTRYRADTFSVHDVRGALVHQGRLDGPETHVDITGAPAGLYIVKTRDAWGKLVIE